MKELAIKLILSCLAVLAPIRPLLIATGVVICLDLVTGLWRAIKNKETISSSVMRRTVQKAFVYNLAIISAFILETYLLDGIPATKMTSSFIGLVESKSILENLNEIHGKNIFKSLLKKLGSDNDKK